VKKFKAWALVIDDERLMTLNQSIYVVREEKQRYATSRAIAKRMKCVPVLVTPIVKRKTLPKAGNRQSFKDAMAATNRQYGKALAKLAQDERKAKK
jgi:hypothetical protein